MDQGSETIPHRGTSANTIRLLVWIAAIPALAIAYYFGIALPSYNQGRLELEREQRVQEQKRTERMDKEAEARKGLLEACLQKASDDYFNYLRLNGTALKGDKISTPQFVSTAAEKRKNDDRDACFKQYGQR